MIKTKPFKPEHTSQHISIDVRDGDAMKAWRKMKKKLANARILEEVKERRYYRKPAEIKREYNKRLKRQAAKNRRIQMLKDGLL